MFIEPNLSAVAALMADPARATMLLALIDGRALPAGELAYAAGITPQTASSHLARLSEGGLLSADRQGRHRYYRLAGPHVAEAMEHLAAIRPAGQVRRRAKTAAVKRLQLARCCYDHLAGQLGVAVAGALAERDFLKPTGNKRLEVTEQGADWFAALDIDVGRLKSGQHGIARQCLDWTERAYHIAGPLGAGLLKAFCDAHWLRKASTPRLVEITPLGELEFKRRLDIDVAQLRCQEA